MSQAHDEHVGKHPKIDGLNLADARCILKYEAPGYARHGFITLSAPMAVLGCDAFQADRHLRALAAAGYLVHDSELPLQRPGKYNFADQASALSRMAEQRNLPGSHWGTQTGAARWYQTDIAWRLRVDKLLKRMTRRDAKKLFDRLISEVQRINAFPETLVCVTGVHLFGSLLDPSRESYGDIDLYIEIDERPIEADLRDGLVDSLAEEARRTGGFMMTYEHDERAALIRSRRIIDMRLEKLGRRISISHQRPEDIGTVSAQIYAFDPRTGKDACRTLDEASQCAQGRIREQNATPAIKQKGDIRAITVGTPEIISKGRNISPSFGEAIRTDTIIERTARLLEIEAPSIEPCHTCCSFWCTHIAPSNPPPVVSGSGDHYLLALQNAMQEHPLGPPIREVRQAVQILSDDMSGHWCYKLSREHRYLSITKAGVKFDKDLIWSGHVSKYDDFAVSNGRIDFTTSTADHSDVASFIALMRMREALMLLWKSCAFKGGGDAGVILDLMAPDVESLEPTDLRVLGKLLNAAQPARKEIIRNTPYPKEYATAIDVSVDGDSVYRPGFFDLIAEIDEAETSVRIVCKMRTDKNQMRHIGDRKGYAAETSKARNLLKNEVSKHTKEIRALPGFRSAFLDVVHELDYPK